MAHDLVNKKFGKLLVLSSHSDTYVTVNGRKVQRKYWDCKCDCGKITTVSSWNLTRGRAKSCGCLRKVNPKRVNTNRQAYGESSKTYVINCYKRHARNIGLEFNLTREECLDLFSKNCIYCGGQPSNKVEKKGLYGIFIYNGIDRVQNKKGYLKDNCVPCCKICNDMKGSMESKAFYNQIQKIFEFANWGGVS